MRLWMDTEFWVVTKPTPMSEMSDVCFKARIADLMKMAKGGLDPDDVLGVFKSPGLATKYAERVLNDVKEEYDKTLNSLLDNEDLGDLSP